MPQGNRLVKPFRPAGIDVVIKIAVHYQVPDDEISNIHRIVVIEVLIVKILLHTIPRIVVN